jgi:hypothetical protein
MERMKKIALLIPAIALVFSLAACSEATEQARQALQNAKVRIETAESSDGEASSGEDASSLSPEREDDPGGLTPEDDFLPVPPVTDGGRGGDSLIEWMKAGEFYFDYVTTVDMDSITAEVAGRMAARGGDLALSFEMILMDQPVGATLLILGGEIYAIDDTNKTVEKLPEIPPDMLNGIVTDYSGITFEASGTGEINGKILPWEEYDENGVFVRYYFEGGGVYAIETDDNGMIVTMLITNASREASPEMFTLPSGYAGALPEAQSV